MTKPSASQRFLDLMEEHRRILYKVSSAYSRNPADREDLVQEMVAQLWRSFGRYDESYRFSTWMYRVALNVAISFHRSESRRARHLVPADDSILQVAADPAGQDERMEEMHRAIRSLEEMDRALVILHLEGHRYDAIAEIMGISESNVGTRLSRVRQQMRRTVAQTH